MADQAHSVMPPLPKGFGSPFWYASLYSFKTFHQAPRATLELFLKGTGLKPAAFVDNKVLRPDIGYVSMEFQSYTADLGSGLSTTNEVELNVICYPAARESMVPALTLEEYLYGYEQQKLIGGFHVCVPADNKVAVQAGIAFFGEPKFYAPFLFNVPSPNNPSRQTTWTYTVCDPSYVPPSDPNPPPPPPEMIIYQLNGDLAGAQPAIGDPSSFVLYGMLPGGKIVGEKEHKGDLIANRWDVFSGYQSYVLSEDQQANIHVNYGRSRHPMRAILQKLLGAAPAPAVSVQTYQTPPCAAESRAYYLQPHPSKGTAAPKPAAKKKGK
jgi:hypothetical protein